MNKTKSGKCFEIATVLKILDDVEWIISQPFFRNWVYVSF